ncbi:MAG: STAS domain-containing protein [Vicinamibacterales bacterium]
MRITERTAGAATILEFEGKLVAGPGLGLLQDKVNSLIYQGRRRLVFNLEGLSSIDSAGQGQLVTCQTTVSGAGGSIALCHVDGRHRDLLVLTRLLTTFDIVESEEDAIAYLSAA